MSSLAEQLDGLPLLSALSSSLLSQKRRHNACTSPSSCGKAVSFTRGIHPGIKALGVVHVDLCRQSKKRPQAAPGGEPRVVQGPQRGGGGA